MGRMDACEVVGYVGQAGAKGCCCCHSRVAGGATNVGQLLTYPRAQSQMHAFTHPPTPCSSPWSLCCLGYTSAYYRTLRNTEACASCMLACLLCTAAPRRQIELALAVWEVHEAFVQKMRERVSDLRARRELKKEVEAARARQPARQAQGQGQATGSGVVFAGAAEAVSGEDLEQYIAHRAAVRMGQGACQAADCPAPVCEIALLCWVSVCGVAETLCDASPCPCRCTLGRPSWISIPRRAAQNR